MTNAKILIVHGDDSAASRLEAHLKDMGHAVCAAVSSGPEALEKAAETRPDLALIDLGLEGEADGIEAARRIGERFGVPVVYLTDEPDEDLLQRAEETGPFGYVVQPVDDRQLRLAIRTALSLHERESSHRKTVNGLEQTIDELRHRGRLMGSVLDSTSDGIIAADETGEYLVFNAKAKQTFGSVMTERAVGERSGTYGLFLSDRVTPFSDADLPLTRAISGESSDGVEMFVRNADVPAGLLLSVSGRPLHGHGSGVKGGVVVFHDISVRMESRARLEQAVSELRDQNKLMETVLDNINDGVIISNVLDKMLFMNQRAKQMIGTDLDMPLSERSSRYGIFYPDGETQVPVDELVLTRATRGEEPDEAERVIRNQLHPAGIYVSVRGRPVLNDDGTRIKAGFAVFRDITEQKKAGTGSGRNGGVQPGQDPVTKSAADSARPDGAVSTGVAGGRETAARLERTVNELRNQTELLQTICDNMSEGIVVTDNRGQLLFVNAVTEKVFGEWAVNPDLSEWSQTYGIFHPDVKTHVPVDEIPLVRALRGETPDEMEVFVRNQKNPAGSYVIARAQPILGNDKSEVVAALAIFRDVTKDKEAEAQLAQTLGELRNQSHLMTTVFENMSDGLVVIDTTGVVLLANAGSRKIFGMGIMDVEPAEWASTYGIFYPDKETPVPFDQTPLMLALQGEETGEMEFFVRNENRPAGTYVSAGARPLWSDDKQEVIGSVGIIRDVTEYKRTQAELQQTIRDLRYRSELMETTFNSVSEGIVVADSGGKFLYINPAAEHILGRDHIAKRQGKWSEKSNVFYYPDRETPISSEELPLPRAIFRGEPTDNEDIYIPKANGQDGVYIRVSARPLLNEISGDRAGVIVFRDVTAQVRADEALTQAFTQGRLEIVDTILHNVGNAINSVTIGVDTVQRSLLDAPLLRRFSALADALEAHREDWTGYIRDDPQGRQVLPFVVALAQDLTRQNGELIKTVDRVGDRAKHIADIVRTQKALGSSSMERKDIGLEDAITSAVKVLQESLDKRGVEVVIDRGNAPRQIRIHESRFHQMMVNLIKNSMEAIDELAMSGELKEAPRIRIRTYIKGDFFHLDVSDNGIGIKPRTSKMLFAAGYTTKESGSGLGLHSIANFVIGAGGQIRPLSDGIGRGTTMRIMLRLSSVTLPAGAE